MNRFKCFAFSAPLFLTGFLTFTGTSGREIMEMEKERQELQDEERVVEMHLIDRRNKIKKRTVRMWNMETEEGLEKFMLVFMKPRDVKGTGLLTWEQKGRDDDQWLYLPSLKKEKRIAAGSKKNRFMGTEFAYEDLALENLDRHEYKLAGSKKLNGHECYLVEAMPKSKKDRKNSGYSKRVIWIRKDIFYTARVEYHNKKRKLVKVLENGDPVNISGTVWRSNEFIMKNLKSKRRTRMMVKERTINQGLVEQAFSVRKLKSF